MSYKFSKFLPSFVFAVAIAAVPWEQILGSEFADLKNYLQYFTQEVSVLEYKVFNKFYDYLFSEVLWHYAVSVLIHDLHIPAKIVFFWISVLYLTISTLFLINRHRVISCLFLVNPLVIGLAMSQLRIALAFSLLLIAYECRVFLIACLFVLCALFIHTSTLIFVLLFIIIRLIAAKKLLRKANRRKIFIALCMVGFAISIAIGPLKEVVLGYFGDRRANYSGDASSSLMYTSFWFGMLVLSAFQKARFMRDEASSYTIIILSLATLNVLTGGYTTRFIALSLPMIASSMLRFEGRYRDLAIVAYVVYMTFQWVYWLQLKII